MLPLLLEDPKLTSTTFNKVTEHCRYATKATYWIALLAAATACGRATPVDAKSMKKFLEGRTWAEEPTLKEAADHDMIERTANVLPPIMQDAVRLSFVLGQRLSDVLKMQRKSLNIFQQHLSLTFYAGKVIQKIGPYSINLAATLEPIRSIVDRALARTTSNEDHIFVSGAVGDEKHVHKAISEALGVDVRAIRRGGLQAMARGGATLEAIRYFSKHASDRMLLKYLNNGRDVAGIAPIASRTLEVAGLAGKLPFPLQNN